MGIEWLELLGDNRDGGVVLIVDISFSFFEDMVGCVSNNVGRDNLLLSTLRRGNFPSELRDTEEEYVLPPR